MLVSNRGSLPHVVGGDVREGGAGYVLPLPDWLTAETLRLPSEAEVEPWFDAVCALWDDAAQYRLVAQRAEALGRERYSEAASRQRHVDYFTSLKPGDAVLTPRRDRRVRTWTGSQNDVLTTK